MDVDAAAARIGIARRTLQRLVADGKIGCYKVGRRVLFSDEDVDAFLASVHQPATVRQASPSANRMRTGRAKQVSSRGGWRPPQTPPDQQVRGRRVS